MSSYKERKAVFEEMTRRLPTEKELYMMPKEEELAWYFVSIYDSIIKAKNIIESRTPAWKRIVKIALSLIGSIILIWGSLSLKKLDIFPEILSSLKKGD